MRKTEVFESYLDDFNSITVFLSKNFYGGKSTVFYLRNQCSRHTVLKIANITESGNQYYKYQLECEGIEIGQSYDIIEEHSLSTPLQFALITKRKGFDDLFAYDGDDLGVHIHDHETRFALWAPTATSVRVVIESKEGESIHALQRSSRGVFRLALPKNLHGAHYVYLVGVNGKVNRTLDPYGVASIANEKANVIIDFTQCVTPDKHALPVLKSRSDCSILECNVRDFSFHANSGIKHPGTFVGMCEEKTTNLNGNPTGFDYVRQLGFTHIQLMPVFDFATVDELNKTVFYNWGYDPVQFGVCEGSYTTNPNDGILRVNEFAELVNHYHKHGMRMTMDVVFNHVYSIENSSFDKIVPYYYFRCNENGDLSNGSFCGNDFDSKMAMNRKFIVDNCVYWMTRYGVDGFRFDLMGILDIQTMNDIYQKTSALKKDVLLYGEGWNMPTMLGDDEKAMIQNSSLMPEIGFFNDFFRDHVKGKSNESEVSVKGYLTGDLRNLEAMKACLLGNASSKGCVRLFNSPQQSINYVECHDNHTLWDKIKECCKEDSKAVRLRKHKMSIAALFLAQGIPFMQLGQEFCRSKSGLGNTYNSPDVVNQLDWMRKDQYGDVVLMTQDFIQLRKDFDCFRFTTDQEMDEHIRFSDLDREVLIYQIEDIEHPAYESLVVYFNPTAQEREVSFSHEAEALASTQGRLHGQHQKRWILEAYDVMVFGVLYG